MRFLIAAIVLGIASQMSIAQDFRLFSAQRTTQFSCQNGSCNRPVMQFVQAPVQTVVNTVRAVVAPSNVYVYSTHNGRAALVPASGVGTVYYLQANGTYSNTLPR